MQKKGFDWCGTQPQTGAGESTVGDGFSRKSASQRAAGFDEGSENIWNRTVALQGEEDDQPEDERRFEEYFAFVELAVGTKTCLGITDDVAVGENVEAEIQDVARKIVFRNPAHPELVVIRLTHHERDACA